MPLFVWRLLLPLVILAAIVDVLTMGESRKARLYRRQGMSQRAIAAQMGISRYKVRQILSN